MQIFGWTAGRANSASSERAKLFSSSVYFVFAGPNEREVVIAADASRSSRDPTELEREAPLCYHKYDTQ